MAVEPLVGKLTLNGLNLPIDQLIARLGGQGFRKFLGALTVVEKDQPGRPKSYSRARRMAYCIKSRNELCIPRVKIQHLLDKILAEVRTEPAIAEAHRLGGGIREICAASWRPAQRFYPYQEAAAAYLCDPGGLLDPPTGTAYVQMGTGMGKSRLGMAVAARGRGPVFIVVPTKAIRQQWIDEFKAVYPALSVTAYENPPKNSRKTAGTAATHDVVVGVVNTVRDKTSGFFAGYCTVILDEAHELASAKNLQILWLAQESPRILGLSATPRERPDGLDRIVCHFLGTPVVCEEIPGFDSADVNFRGRVREVEYSGAPEYCEAIINASGSVSAVETVGSIIRDPARLRLVVMEVERLYRLHETEPPEVLEEFGLGPSADGGRPRAHGVFVFAEHREYLPTLREALLDRFAPEDIAVPEIDEPPPPDTACAGGLPLATNLPVVLRGGATRAQISDAHQARIVLTTYGYSRRGISIVEMTSIVLATPRRHGMRQILGRITRRGSDESILRLVVDIKDVQTALKGQNTDRRKIYKEKGYPIYRVRIDHTACLGLGAVAPPTTAEKNVWTPSLPDILPM